MADVAYRQIRRASTKQRLDRNQWADVLQLIIAFDFDGVGSKTQEIEFGMVFEGAPVFSWGVELQEDDELTPNDYPFVTAGVASWVTKTASADERSTLLYLGGTVWYRSVSNRSYRTRLRTSFEGIAYKNPQYLTEQ